MKITKPMMLGKSLKGHNVRSRPADGEEEGDAGELVAAKECRLLSIVLTPKQFDFFCGDDAYRRHFDTPKGKPPVWLESYREFPIPHTYTDCSAELKFGVSGELELKEAVKFKNLKIKIEKGDVPTLNMTLQAPFPRKLETLDFEGFYGKDINGALKFGAIDEEEDRKQGELGLTGEPEEEDDEDEEPRSRRSNGDRPSVN